ncbi:hemolysin family protein [Candidatus Gracilibacteria bacterium]|nr:hemolysin family protein [Candidatus Gracilibacteria bacterium]
MDPILIVIFLLLFCLSAFFSGTELALMSLPEHKVDSLLKQKKYGAQALKHIKSHNDRLLITILIGNNLVNVYTAALATTIAINIGSQMGFAQAQSIGIATGMVTFLLLLFGEIIPKSFATKNATFISLAVAPVYKVAMFVLHPVILFMESLIKVFTSKKELETMSDEEIESFIDMGKNMGGIEDHEHEKIKSILELDTIHVEEIMTPRVKIEAISIDMTVEQAMSFYLAHTHSRIPVYTDTIDKIDHFITSRDLIFAFQHGELSKKVSELDLKNVLKIPLNQPIHKVLHTFQHAHKIMAIVLDEYGGVAGLVTMEDIIEVVFGEIRDETDKEVETIQYMNNDTLLIDSTVLIEDVLEEYGLELQDIGLSQDEFNGETVSYLITHELERFPKNGETILFHIGESDKFTQIIFKVLSISAGQMGQLEVEMVKI